MDSVQKRFKEELDKFKNLTRSVIGLNTATLS